MSTAWIIALLGLAWVVAMGLLLLFMRGAKDESDSQLEDFEQIVAVSQPAELERPHRRAGT